MGADKDPIPDGHAAVYCGEVLDFAVVSNDDRRVDVDIFPDVAALAQPCEFRAVGYGSYA